MIRLRGGGGNMFVKEFFLSLLGRKSWNTEAHFNRTARSLWRLSLFFSSLKREKKKKEENKYGNRPCVPAASFSLIPCVVFFVSLPPFMTGYKRALSAEVLKYIEGEAFYFCPFPIGRRPLRGNTYDNNNSQSNRRPPFQTLSLGLCRPAACHKRS